MTSPAIAEVLAADAARCGATVSGDEAALCELLSPDLLYVHSNGAIDDRQSYVSKVASGAFHYESLDHRITDSRLLIETVAVLSGDMRATGQAGGRAVTLSSRTLSVWQRHEHGRWQLAALHSSSTA